MTGYRRAPAFVADHCGLDFVNAIWPTQTNGLARISSGEDLLTWLAGAGLADPGVLRAVEALAVPGELDAVAARARALGEWFRGFVLEHKGRSLTVEALDQLGPLNRLLQNDQKFTWIGVRAVGVGNGHPQLVWRSQRHWRSTDSLLLPIAEAMSRLVCEEDFTYVRVCEGAGCSRLFLDSTHGRARRWCDMAVCGNRAKQAALLKRKAEQRPV